MTRLHLICRWFCLYRKWEIELRVPIPLSLGTKRPNKWKRKGPTFTSYVFFLPIPLIWVCWRTWNNAMMMYNNLVFIICYIDKLAALSHLWRYTRVDAKQIIPKLSILCMWSMRSTLLVKQEWQEKLIVDWCICRRIFQQSIIFLGHMCCLLTVKNWHWPQTLTLSIYPTLDGVMFC